MTRLVFLAGLAPLFLAVLIALGVVLGAAPDVGTLGGRGDWIWVVLEIYMTTWWLWAFAGFMLLFVFPVFLVLSLASRVIHPDE